MAVSHWDFTYEWVSTGSVKNIFPRAEKSHEAVKTPMNYSVWAGKREEVIRVFGESSVLVIMRIYCSACKSLVAKRLEGFSLRLRRNGNREIMFIAGVAARLCL